MTGEVVYLYAFDVASEIVRERVGTILGQSPKPFDVRQDHTIPRDVPLHQPLSVESGTSYTAGGRPIRVQVRIYDVGAVSVVLRIGLNGTHLDELAPFHGLVSDSGRPIGLAAQEICRDVVQELRPALVRPTKTSDPEAYTVFVVTDLDGPRDIGAWLQEHQRAVAGLLGNMEADKLADSQVTEMLRHRQSFEKTDLIVVDWDAALVVDLNGYVEDVLHVLEMANIQLEEFRVMDQILDQHLTRAYGLMERIPRFLIARPSAALRQIREMSVDLARLADETTHITKFLGDWYLARVYLSARERFHLQEWRASVSQRLSQLNELYTVLRAEVTERRMLWLEALIVIFFAIDLIAILFLKR